MDDRRKLCDYARNEIATLTAEGITLTPDEIVAINSLAHDVISPQTRLHLARGCPVFIGGATLWPLTMYGVDWLSRVTQEMGANDQAYAVGYAMAHGRDMGALDLSVKDAIKLCRKWFWSLRCTRNEFDEALNQVADQERLEKVYQSENDKPMTAGEFSAFISSACGGTPEYWETRCSVGYARAMLVMIATQNRADNKPVAGDPRIVAECALGYYVAEIRKSRQQAKESNG